MAMNKQYGLILPKKEQQKAIPKLSNVFGDDNASDEDDSTDWVRKALKAEGEKNKIKRQTKLDMQKALNEDPTIYQYDEIYDDMERTKNQLDTGKIKEKKPRYIENLLKTAERRKKEQEHRIERMVQKEREAEGEMYADKESFVTSAYRAKLEEFKKMEEEEARMSRLEAIGDVSKQQDMSGFYRHLYKQTIDYQNLINDDGIDKTKKDTEREEKKDLANDTNEKKKENVTVNDVITITDEKLRAKSKRLRQYRQRAIETDESDSETATNKEELKKDEIIIEPTNKNIDKSQIEDKESDRKKQKLSDTNDVEINEYTTNVEKNEDLNIKDKSQDSEKTVLKSKKMDE